jgi:DNA-binding NtrC family response regulator
MEVKTAYSGTEAVSVLANERFDVIILDLKMPHMDGPATLKAIREKDKITPVIILTGHINIEVMTEVLKMGATEVLLKPCHVETLVCAIENAHERTVAAECR